MVLAVELDLAVLLRLPHHQASDDLPANQFHTFTVTTKRLQVYQDLLHSADGNKAKYSVHSLA